MRVGSWHAHPSARAEIRAAARALDQPEDGLWAGDHYGVLADLDLSVD